LPYIYLNLVSSGSPTCNNSIKKKIILLYLSCSQIWLNPLADDHHFWCCNMRKLPKKKKEKEAHVETIVI
jgi:hypothetical protein